LSLRSVAVRRLPMTGKLGLSCEWMFSRLDGNLSLRSAAVCRVPRATLGRQAMRLCGTWAFFQGLEPHVIWKSLCSWST
jgi:hypothetical protein